MTTLTWPQITEAHPGGIALPLTDPASGEVYAYVPQSGELEVCSAVAQAVAAQRQWGGLTPAERSATLSRLADLLETHSEELAQLEARTAGKTIRSVRGGDLPLGIDTLRFFAAAIRVPGGSGPSSLLGGTQSMIRRGPLGVVAAILPWNYPLLIALWKLAPALAAGNAVVLKPAPNTPASALRLAELALQAGLPPGLVGVVCGGAESGELLCTHPDVRMICFTGSTVTGQRIMALAAAGVKRLSLELGGKAPFVVFADADLEAAARGAVVSSFINAGQDCTATTRLYVQQDCFGPFMARFTELALQLRSGPPLDEATDLGPLSSAEHRQRVHAQVERARAQGAQVLLGGVLPPGPGFAYPPTLLTGLLHSAEAVQQEIFGPVVVAFPFDTEAEAVALANGVPYGLASSVWTGDAARALRCSEAIRAGTVWVNEHGLLVAEMPHGGVGASGFGSDMSRHALDEYSAVKHVMFDTSGLAERPWHAAVHGPLT